MSADLLRRAASLIRERAEAATPGPWEPSVHGHEAAVLGQGDIWVARCGGANIPAVAADAAYIAAWHPDVALAVADLLDNEASLIESVASHPELHTPLNEARVDLLLAVARAYLGSDS